MAQWLMVIAAKTDDLNLIPGIHSGETEVTPAG